VSQADQVFLDTSFLIAYHNKKDQNHRTAAICYNDLKRSIPKPRFITTDYIFDELEVATFYWKEISSTHRLLDFLTYQLYIASGKIGAKIYVAPFQSPLVLGGQKIYHGHHRAGDGHFFDRAPIRQSPVVQPESRALQ